MRWHCRESDSAKGFFLTLQQRLHLLLRPGDPAVTRTVPGLPAAWDHRLPAPLQGHTGHQELKQAVGDKGNGASAVWEKGWDWTDHLPKELGWTGETGVHFCVKAPVRCP